MCFGMLLAACSYQNLYPVCLIVPGILQFRQESYASVVKCLISFCATLTVLLLVSSEIAGGWNFLEATYGFM